MLPSPNNVGTPLGIDLELEGLLQDIEGQYSTALRAVEASEFVEIILDLSSE
jgi:hypothetical protein